MRWQMSMPLKSGRFQSRMIRSGVGSTASDQPAGSVRSNINVVSLNIKLQPKQISQFVFIVNKKDTETGLGLALARELVRGC